MDLQRGVCSFCTESTRVLMSSDAEEFSKFLPKILYEHFLSEAEFQQIKNSIKICAICSYKIRVASETKDLMNNNESWIKIRPNTCHFCETNDFVVKVDRNWKYFMDRAEGYFTSSSFPRCACVKCLLYFDTIFNIKTKLLHKFPQLVMKKKRKNEALQKQSDTPKRKFVSKSPQVSKKRKIFKSCFAYLQPLSNNNYYVDNLLKDDERLYKGIAYVDLTNSQDVDVRETPKPRPIIKIKLKPRTKKDDIGPKSKQTHVKLCKSEEIPTKTHPKSKRRHSYVEKTESSEEPEEKINETPKSAIISNTVPKRRVSVYMDNGDIEEDKGEEPEKDKREEPEKEASHKSTDETQPNTHEDLNENGIDKIDINYAATEFHHSNDEINGKKSGNTETSFEGPETLVTEDSSSADSGSSLRKTPERDDSANDASYSDSSDQKAEIRGNEGDIQNGSERKKKRVTFSDEIND